MSRYIYLSILCLLLIIFLPTPRSSQISSKSEIKLNLSKEKITESPYLSIFLILGLAYLTLFIAGIGNLTFFIGRKIRKQPLIAFREEEKKFPLSSDKTAKLFFLITFFVLLSFVLGNLTYTFWKKADFMIPIINNLILEAAVAIVILKYLKRSLNFSPKLQLLSLLKVYTAMLPLILVSLLINNFLLEKMSVKPTLNPAIELFFLSKSKTLSLVLACQVIFLGPVAEELLFRGFIYKIARKKFSFRCSCLLVSLLFALIHRVPHNILPLFIISLALCYLYEKTQNILVPIIFHSLHNSISFTFLIAIKSLI
ncbi:MAG: CPBP family intramembrane metalloprotease [Candidatus Omnitrophica bacterium]|nr:CPBP family intramembrane metalloprotease [Candidatus Omnitrophota bacterium]MBU0878441.1 CPBP family intramembrane metalloprotease [Candidatus Omnitrophota bacterium]MBU1809530.1 CPBP family intramembrane metalloprotease [Candidatus Omnitrophota bacterium]